MSIFQLIDKPKDQRVEIVVAACSIKLLSVTSPNFLPIDGLQLEARIRGVDSVPKGIEVLTPLLRREIPCEPHSRWRLRRHIRLCRPRRLGGTGRSLGRCPLRVKVSNPRDRSLQTQSGYVQDARRARSEEHTSELQSLRHL